MFSPLRNDGNIQTSLYKETECIQQIPNLPEILIFLIVFDGNLRYLYIFHSYLHHFSFNFFLVRLRVAGLL